MERAIDETQRKEKEIYVVCTCGLIKRWKHDEFKIGIGIGLNWLAVSNEEIYRRRPRAEELEEMKNENKQTNKTMGKGEGMLCKQLNEDGTHLFESESGTDRQQLVYQRRV